MCLLLGYFSDKNLDEESYFFLKDKDRTCKKIWYLS
jgi:hypothetical protein